MDNNQLIDEAIEIISESVLTPIIYMINTDDHVCFVCFLGGETPYEQIVVAESKLSELLKLDAVIMDIREFTEDERLDILGNAELIFCADAHIKQLFEISLLNDVKRAFEEKTRIVDRSKNCSSIYLN